MVQSKIYKFFFANFLLASLVLPVAASLHSQLLRDSDLTRGLQNEQAKADKNDGDNGPLDFWYCDRNVRRPVAHLWRMGKYLSKKLEDIKKEIDMMKEDGCGDKDRKAEILKELDEIDSRMVEAGDALSEASNNFEKLMEDCLKFFPEGLAKLIKERYEEAIEWYWHVVTLAFLDYPNALDDIPDCE